MAFGVYISGTVTISISRSIRSIEYPSNKQEGSRVSILRSRWQSAHGQEANGNRPCARPGTSATTNHRAAFRETVFDVSHNAPHGAEHCKVKGRGPVSIGDVLTAISLMHRWPYIYVNTARHTTCQSGVWKRLVGNSVRCLVHFRMLALVANSLSPWITA